MLSEWIMVPSHVTQIRYELPPYNLIEFCYHPDDLWQYPVSSERHITLVKSTRWYIARSEVIWMTNLNLLSRSDDLACHCMSAGKHTGVDPDEIISKVAFSMIYTIYILLLCTLWLAAELTPICINDHLSSFIHCRTSSREASIECKTLYIVVDYGLMSRCRPIWRGLL